jgi:hypothetical protein
MSGFGCCVMLCLRSAMQLRAVVTCGGPAWALCGLVLPGSPRCSSLLHGLNMDVRHRRPPWRRSDLCWDYVKDVAVQRSVHVQRQKRQLAVAAPHFPRHGCFNSEDPMKKAPCHQSQTSRQSKRNDSRKPPLAHSLLRGRRIGVSVSFLKKIRMVYHRLVDHVWIVRVIFVQVQEFLTRFGKFWEAASNK